MTDEIERLRAELAAAYDVQRDLIKSDDAVSKAIGVEYLLDPPDGGDVSLAEGVERIKAERDALRALLRECRSGWYLNEELNARIGAALNKGGDRD